MNYLIPPSASWRGTVGTIIRPGEFTAYLRTVVFTDDWRPQGLVIHNTAAPDGKQWDATVAGPDPVADAVARARNLTAYYQSLGWQGGPHFFVDDELAIEFNPLSKRGTHSRCFNATHLSIEMVGDFEREPFDSGRGAKVRDLTVEIAAALHLRFGWNPKDLKFHRDCVVDQHACPGKNVKKPELIARIEAAMRGDDDHSHSVDTVAPPVDSRPRKALADLLSAIKPDTEPEAVAAMLTQAAMNANGASLDIDGWRGPKTNAAVKAYAAKL